MAANKIILFDGVCNLCNSSVRFIIKHDHRQVFKFGSLQSEAGSELLKNEPGLRDSNTVILIDNGEMYTKSDAFIRIMHDLGRPYKYFSLLRIIPSFIRDFFYKLISKHRYKIFGRKDNCMVPDDRIKNRFISG